MSAGWRNFLRAALLLAGVALHAGDYEYNVGMVTGADAEIRLTVPGGQISQAGFLPLRVRVNNRSTSERVWRLRLDSVPTGGGYPAGGSQVSSIHSLEVPAASTREFFLFAPVATAIGRPSSIHCELAGPQVQRSEFNLSLSWGWGGRNAAIAVEPVLEARLRETLLEQFNPSPSLSTLSTRAGRAAAAAGVVVPIHRPSRPPVTTVQNVAAIDPALWPADWRLWSPFATVLLEEATWERLDTARRRALLDWVALGGRLVRLNSPTVTRESHGVGVVITRAGPMLAGSRDINEFLMNDPSRLADPTGQLANSAFWDLAPRDWQLRGRHRWLTGYILLFGLLIGPVNLFLFAPAGRRHRLFLTVPAISCVGAVVLFLVITVRDGFGGAGTRRALVVLQPAQNQAVVFQRQISRTGLLTGRKFPLPADALFNLDSDERPGSGLTQQLWREGDEASGDWFTSRSTQQHTVRRLLPTRERVELVSPPGAPPVVQSTVSGALKDFIFLDQSGVFWTAAELPPGTRVALARTTGPLSAEEHPLAKFVQSPSGPFFYALGGAGGFIPTLPSIRWRDDRVIYAGRLESERETRQ